MPRMDTLATVNESRGYQFMRRFLLGLLLLVFASFAIAAVNINTATKEELDVLPGIGPVKAQAIVDYRKANGPFKSLDDLKKVKRIGDDTFDKLRGDIAIGGASTPAKAAPAATATPAKTEPAKMAAPAAAPQAPTTPVRAQPPVSADPIVKNTKSNDTMVKDAKVKRRRRRSKPAQHHTSPAVGRSRATSDGGALVLYWRCTIPRVREG